MLKLSKTILQSIIVLYYNIYIINKHFVLSSFGRFVLWRFLIEFINPLCFFLFDGGSFDFAAYLGLILKQYLNNVFKKKTELDRTFVDCRK